MRRGPAATSCSATRHGPRPTAMRAFTLVEILVVIVILGIATGLTIALVAPDQRDRSLREARRFAGGIEYAAQRAQWRNRMLGVSVSGNVVRYWRRDDAGDHWRLVDDDDVLEPHALAAPVQGAALAYAGRRIAADAIVPLRASGNNEPFAFALTADGWRSIVAADPLNRVRIEGPTRLPQ